MIARLCLEVDGISMLVCKPMAVVCKRTVRHVGLQTNAKCLQNKVSFQIIGNIDITFHEMIRITPQTNVLDVSYRFDCMLIGHVVVEIGSFEVRHFHCLIFQIFS